MPRAIRRQRWSAFLHSSHVQSVQHVSIPVCCGVEMPGHDAVMAAWEALHLALVTMGIQSVEGLSEWICGQGFPQPRWCAHFCGRAQERLLNSAAHINARVTCLESAHVQVVLQACQHGVRQEQEEHRVRRVAPEPTSDPDARWDVMDDVNLEEISSKRFRVLQSCPFQMRGRFRQATRVALETLHNGVVGHDSLMKTRGWKLFILLPFMLLWRPRGHAKVGKDELCRRFDKFSAGRWADLIREGHQATTQGVDTTRIGADSLEHRAVAACHKTKLGKNSRARQCLAGAPLAPGTEETFQLLHKKRRSNARTSQKKFARSNLSLPGLWTDRSS